MPVCTECGFVMHLDDAAKHVCDVNDLPEKGKPIPKGKTKAEAALIV